MAEPFIGPGIIHFSPADYADADRRDWGPRRSVFTGVSYCGSKIRMGDVKDGASHTYAVGERYINPDHYDDGDSLSNNAPMYVGIQTDLYRSTYYEDLPGNTLESVRLPHRDEAGLDLDEHFGSAHAGGLHMSMCDGSTRFIPYDIDGIVHSRSGNRADGAVSHR